MQAVAVHVISDLPLAKKTLFDDLADSEKERRASAHSHIANALAKITHALAETEK
jgi:hypothetical protein